MNDKIDKNHVEKYYNITKKALEIAKKSIVNKNKKEAKEIIDMVSNYLSDAEYFKDKKNFVDSFAAINYSHGWLDSGMRLGIFDIKDNKLFTVK